MQIFTPLGHSGGAVIVNVCAAEVPPPGVGLTTVTLAVPADATSLALIAAVLQDVHLILDFAAEAEDGIGIPFEETFLLEFEQAQELAVFREFLAKRFNDAMPVHRF